MFKKKRLPADFREPDPTSLMGRPLDWDFFFEFRQILQDVSQGQVREYLIAHGYSTADSFYEAAHDAASRYRKEPWSPWACYDMPTRFVFAPSSIGYCLAGLMMRGRTEKHPIAYVLKHFNDKLDYEIEKQQRHPHRADEYQHITGRRVKVPERITHAAIFRTMVSLAAPRRISARREDLAGSAAGCPKADGIC